MGVPEALLLAVAFWFTFALISTMYYWAISGSTRPTALTKLINRVMLGKLSDRRPTESDIAASRAATRPWRTALAAIIGAGLVVLTQWGALSYALDSSPAVESGARTVMAAEFAAAALWAAYLVFEWRRGGASPD